MCNLIPNGVWPTMITLFTEDDKIDLRGTESLVEWYLRNGVHGIFAVCQSSEMFHMSLEERVALARFVVERVAGRVPVIASGHVSASLEQQINELRAMADTGIDALVLVGNRLAQQDESDDVWKRNAERVLKEVADIPLGLYECPLPYKRLATPELLRWCASTGRFLFLKGTSCSVKEMQRKVEVLRSTNLKVFNANAATLLESLRIGVSGYSGVMANFHPDLYVWLVENWQEGGYKVKHLQDFLGLSSVIELQFYPVNAKYYLQRCGLPVSLYTRVKSHTHFTESMRLEVDQLFGLSSHFRASLASLSSEVAIACGADCAR